MLFTFVLLFALPGIGQCHPEAKRLYINLLSKYNKLIRPTGNNTDRMTVKLGLRLTQLVDIDEKNQIMTTNVWLRHEWNDPKLRWDPKDYGDIDLLYVPSTLLWLPDIMLYNNADGNYQVTLMTKATLHYSGKVVWEPPAIYKSSCPINVEFFPFDIQHCSMKFGSWTYDGYQVDLQHVNQPPDASDNYFLEIGIDLKDFYQNVEWDIFGVSARRNEKFYTCCAEPYPDLTFNITLRRKTLFYSVNLIAPCVGISFLSVLVFYLPSDSGEKVTLSISILLSLVWFFLLLAEIIPPTSLVVPLIGKYLVFTMVLITLSVIVTVIVLNLNYRSSKTHTMSPWIRRLFLHVLPKLLLIKRPNLNSLVWKERFQSRQGSDSRQGVSESFEQQGDDRRTTFEQWDGRRTAFEQQGDIRRAAFEKQWNSRRTQFSERASLLQQYTIRGDTKKGMEAVKFIAGRMRRNEAEREVIEDWKYVAMVIDRLFLWIFTTACLVGTMGIIMQAPTLYDPRKPLDVELSERFLRNT